MPEIVYQDEHLLLVVKPVGLTAQLDAAGGDSLPYRLEQQGLPVQPVHRLDRATGGMMVYARTGKAAAALSAMVQQHEVFEKEYLAIVRGCPEEKDGMLEDLLFHDVRKNKSYVVDRPRKGVKAASLSYRVLGTADTPDGVCSLVRIRLHTGRTHQIRVQFASRKMPLLGDSRYGGSRQMPLALWSYRLSFPHPITRQPLLGKSLPDFSAAPWNLFRPDNL